MAPHPILQTQPLRFSKEKTLGQGCTAGTRTQILISPTVCSAQELPPVLSHGLWSGRQQPESQTWGVPQSAGRGGPRRQEVRRRSRGLWASGAGARSPGVRLGVCGAVTCQAPPHLRRGDG